MPYNFLGLLSVWCSWFTKAQSVFWICLTKMSIYPEDFLETTDRSTVAVGNGVSASELRSPALPITPAPTEAEHCLRVNPRVMSTEPPPCRRQLIEKVTLHLFLIMSDVKCIVRLQNHRHIFGYSLWQYVTLTKLYNVLSKRMRVLLLMFS